MNYRDDRPKCPTCTDPAVAYDALWDYHRCPNDHRWDGPINGGQPVSPMQAERPVGRGTMARTVL